MDDDVAYVFRDGRDKDQTKQARYRPAVSVSILERVVFYFLYPVGLRSIVELSKDSRPRDC